MTSEIPQKLTDWLLFMGCPPDKIPPLEKLKQMCRGDYYMVWRNMMQKVQSKQVISEKRLQVFLDDIRRYQDPKNRIKEKEYKNPDEMLLWKQHKDLSKDLQNEELKIKQKKQHLQELMNKVSTKIAQKLTIEARVQDCKRRSWMLERVAEDLGNLKENLNKMKDIAISFQQQDDATDVQIKVDKCVSLYSKQNASNPEVNPSMASVSMMSTTSESSDCDLDDQLSSLMSVSSGAVWSHLYDRRADLVRQLSDANTQVLPDHHTKNRITAQSVLAESAALHCNLVLDTVKNQSLVTQLRHTLATTLDEYHNVTSPEGRELVVLQCERAKCTARVEVLRTHAHELAARRGLFKDSLSTPNPLTLTCIHRGLETKKSELQRLMAKLSKTEYRIQNVRESLQTMFKSFKTDNSNQQRRTESELRQQLIWSTCQFYEQRKNSLNKTKVDLSMDLDMSENSSSFTENKDQEKKFSDELKMYLKSFNLEKNRKLVLESGETLWIFESLQECGRRLLAQYSDDSCIGQLLCPVLTVSKNIERLEDTIRCHGNLEALLKMLKEDDGNTDLQIRDISTLVSEAEQSADKVKKELNANMVRLHKVEKSIDSAKENLRLFADNSLRKYISDERLVGGNTYKQIETIYLTNLNPCA